MTIESTLGVPVQQSFYSGSDRSRVGVNLPIFSRVTDRLERFSSCRSRHYERMQEGDFGVLVDTAP